MRIIRLANILKGLSLEQIDLLWASEEYRTSSQEAQVIEGVATEKLEHPVDEEATNV